MYSVYVSVCVCVVCSVAIRVCVCVAVIPLVKNVLKCCSMKNKLLESPEVEKEVERLMREDLEATNIVILLCLTPYVCMCIRQKSFYLYCPLLV